MIRNVFSRLPKRVQAHLRQVIRASTVARGFLSSDRWLGGNGEPASAAASAPPAPARTPLEASFDAHTEGRGIWKWRHYLEIYHRHFSKFIGREVHVLEIGVYSGGSLDMWRAYFGPRCHVYGVDIEAACKAYEDDSVKIFIGDQADPAFWKRFKKEVPHVDIIIDDGGHLVHQQITTFEEMLPHLRPGGVYLCEDLQGAFNAFSDYITGFAFNLNACRVQPKAGDAGAKHASDRTGLQHDIHSVHFYPFVVVIERTEGAVPGFVAPRQGSEWQPFL